jgi:hypothetical protein
MSERMDSRSREIKAAPRVGHHCTDVTMIEGCARCNNPPPRGYPPLLKEPFGAGPRICSFIHILESGRRVCVWRGLRVGGARWGVIRGSGTTPTGELLNKHTHTHILRHACGAVIGSDSGWLGPSPQRALAGVGDNALRASPVKSFLGISIRSNLLSRH